MAGNLTDRQRENGRPRQVPAWSGLGRAFCFYALALAVALVCLANLGFLLGLAVGPWNLPLAAALALAGTWAWSRSAGRAAPAWRDALAGAGLVWAVLGLGLFLATRYNDMSYDGQCYHQLAILSLLDGWNPLWEPYLPFHHYPVQNYPKASWYLAASLTQVFGSVEYGKAFNYLLPTVAGAALFQFLKGLGRAPLAVRLLLSVCAAFTPTALCQLNSFYLDGLLVSGLLLALLFSLEYYLYGDRRVLWLLLLVSLFLINLKYTGLVYVGVFLIGFWLALLWRKRQRHWAYFRCAAAGGLLGVLVLGFNPYVLNTVHFGSPVHPMPGENVARYQAPQEFIAKNRVEKLAWSLFARCSANMKSMPQLKIPFTVSAYEWEHLGTTSLRYSGLGPWFSGALVLLPLALLMVWRRSRSWAKACLALCGLILASVFFIPETWFSRFVPQIWFIPLIWAAALWWSPGEKWRTAAKALAVAICLTLLVNQAMVLAGNWLEWHGVQSVFDQQVKELGKASQTRQVLVKGPWRAVRNRLDSAGLRYEWVDKLPCTRPERIAGTHSTHWYCLDGIKP